VVQQFSSPPLDVHDLVERELGVQVQEEEVATTVGATDAQLFTQNPKRVAFLVTNLSAGVIFIRPKATASSTTGIRLSPNGGQAYIFWREDLTLPAKEWRIIGDGAGLAFYALALNMY